MVTYKKLTYDGSKIQVDSAVRDGNGADIAATYLPIATALTDYQAKLVSGTNIKTLEGQSLLGSGDISLSDIGLGTVYKFKGSVASYSALPASPSNGDVYNVESAYGDYPAGTNWAWNGTTWDALGGSIDLTPYLTKTEAASTYQVKLVSGTNIKTIGGTSILGSGNVALSAGTGISISGLTISTLFSSTDVSITES